MLATELLFVYLYCLVDDAIKAGVLSIPRRPGPAPACTDAELLTIALVSHLLGRRSENGFVAEVRRDWPHLFPHLPGQPDVNRRTRWLWGAFETEDELDEIQRAFVDVLRAHAEAWPLNPAETYLVLPGDEYYGYPLVPGQSAYGRLLVIVDIPAPGESLILLTAGAYLDRDHVIGDELHGQMFTLPAEPTPIGFEESGRTDVLAACTGHWFGALLHRPMVRYEWLRSGEVYAHRWLFADSGQPLGEGRIRTGGLGSPDRIVNVRGEST